MSAVAASLSTNSLLVKSRPACPQRRATRITTTRLTRGHQYPTSVLNATPSSMWVPPTVLFMQGLNVIVARRTYVVGTPARQELHWQGLGPCRGKFRQIRHLSAHEGDAHCCKRGGVFAKLPVYLALTTTQELDSVFYFSPGHLAGTFHCIAPSLHDVTYVLYA